MLFANKHRNLLNCLVFILMFPYDPPLQMIEECGRRFSRDEQGDVRDEDEWVQEFLEIVKEALPPPPPKAEAVQE